MADTKHRWVGMGGSGHLDWCYRCGALRMVSTITDPGKVGPYYIPSGGPVVGNKHEPRCENHNNPLADPELTNKLRWEALRQLFVKMVMDIMARDDDGAHQHIMQMQKIFDGEGDIGMVLEGGDDDQG